MPFIGEIPKYKSLSIVGMAKNTGKTECLNYILGHYRQHGEALAITSIGVDGESADVVFQTAKPEITFYENMLVQTSEKHFAQRQAGCEILDVSKQQTALGRLVTARIKTEGKLILSGSSHTKGLLEFVDKTRGLGAKTCLIDGALSRMSLASPAIAEAMVLCTGAALSKSLPVLVQKTKFQYDLIRLPLLEDAVLREKLELLEQGVWGIDAENEVHSLGIISPLLLASNKHKFKKEHGCIYVAGVINDALLEFLRLQKIRLIIPDFSKVFAGSLAWNMYSKTCGEVRVIRQTKLLGVCVNPWSPEGYTLDSLKLREALGASLGIRVWDLRE